MAVGLSVSGKSNERGGTGARGRGAGGAAAAAGAHETRARARSLSSWLRGRRSPWHSCLREACLCKWRPPIFSACASLLDTAALPQEREIDSSCGRPSPEKMGRTPCCDKVGIKKGPWTPEEDLVLVSYIQEHGPGNWRSVPVNTGLMRCSKSCRLRWTNCLRPGIRRGNFTPHEEGVIVHLQSLLGNKWAAIASYLPQRTDNDIKNYWNTHLKKKLKKHQAIGAIFAPPPPSDLSSTASPAAGAGAGHVDPGMITNPFTDNYTRSTCSNPGDVTQLITRRSPFAASGSSLDAESSSSSSHASSMDNISKLLDGFMNSTTPRNDDGADIKPSVTEVNPLLSFVLKYM